MVSVVVYHGTDIEVIVAGDFNAHSVAGGDRSNDFRGKDLYTLADFLGLTIANVGREPTFFMGERESIVDVTLVSEATSGRLRQWRVQTDVENLSDHHYITFSYSDRRITSVSGATPSGRGTDRRRWCWCTAQMDAKLLVAAVVVSECTGDA